MKSLLAVVPLKTSCQVFRSGLPGRESSPLPTAASFSSRWGLVLWLVFLVSRRSDQQSVCNATVLVFYITCAIRGVTTTSRSLYQRNVSSLRFLPRYASGSSFVGSITGEGGREGGRGEEEEEEFT